MNILYLKDLLSLPTNGGERNMLSLLERLAQVELRCCTTLIDPVRLASLIRAHGGKVLGRSPGTLRYSIGRVVITAHLSPHYTREWPDRGSTGRVLLEILERQRPDVVLTMLTDYQALAAAHRWAGRRLTFLMDDEYPRPENPLLTGSGGSELATVFSELPRVMTCSAYLAKSFAAAWDRPTTVLYGQIERRAYLVPPDLAPLPGDRHVGMVNPVAVKGVNLFLSAAKLFPDLRFSALLNWIGTPEQRNGLDRLRAELPNLRFEENTPDPRGFYARTALLLVPSRWHEGFGRVAVEALLNGIPVLASRIGGLPEAVPHTPWLLPPPTLEAPARTEEEYRAHHLWFETMHELLQPRNTETVRATALQLAKTVLGVLETSYRTFLGELSGTARREKEG